MYFNDSDLLWALAVPALIFIGIGTGIGWLIFG